MQNGSFLPLINKILKNKKINITAFVLYNILNIFFVFAIIQKVYTSETSIIPSAANFTSNISGSIGTLSQLAGIDVGGQSAQSQEMYVGILNSRRLLEKVIYKDYTFDHESSQYHGNLIEFLEIEGETDVEMIEIALKEIRENVAYMDIDSENEILSLAITTPFPELSSEVANYMVKVLNDLVKNEIQKEYRQQLSYIEQKVRESADELEESEKELKQFLEQNTDPSIPEFQVLQLKLRRNLEIQTEIYIEYRKQLEVFIVENMINLSDIKVLDKAFPPYKKSRPKRLLLLISFGILGLFVQLSFNAVPIIYSNAKKIVSQNN